MLLDKESLPMVAMKFMNELFELVLLYEKKPSLRNKAKVDQLYLSWWIPKSGIYK